LRITIIYNEIDIEGSFKAVYYNSIQHPSKVKFVINRKRKLVELSDEQQEKIKEIVPWFIGGQTDYDYSADENTDYNLSVTCDDGLRQVNYYYWKNKDQIPKGVERLLKFFEEIFVDFTVTNK
jgi:hypothetical protein